MKVLIDFDEFITYKLAVCADPRPRSVQAYVRFLLQLLELSFHGVPWFFLCFFAYFMDYVPMSVLKPIFLGKPLWFSDFVKFTNYICTQGTTHQGLVVDLASIGLIKSIFKRKRPRLNRDDMYGTTGPDFYSFPSGHASRAIMISNLCIHLFAEKLSPMHCRLLNLWSYSTCISRLLLARHHFFDILCGIALGHCFYYCTIACF
jgi:membrane-associated phospholipid phosphatase